MIYFWDIKQKTDEWHALRAGKMTGMNAQAIGNIGKGLETYCRNIVLGKIVKIESFVSRDMERGNELEPIARLKYSLEFDVDVLECGFIQYNDFVGISPDGLIGSDGMIEIKARNDEKHFGLLLGDPIDPATIWQMNMQMLCSGRSWCDFISYNPNFKQSLFVKRIYPDNLMKTSLLKGFEVGERLIKKLSQQREIELELTNKNI